MQHYSGKSEAFSTKPTVTRYPFTFMFEVSLPQAYK